MHIDHIGKIISKNACIIEALLQMIIVYLRIHSTWLHWKDYISKNTLVKLY